MPCCYEKAIPKFFPVSQWGPELRKREQQKKDPWNFEQERKKKKVKKI